MFVANLSGAGDPFIWNIFNPESRGCHPMIFFLVHFRRYRKPVKIDIHLRLVRAIQEYRMILLSLSTWAFVLVFFLAISLRSLSRRISRLFVILSLRKFFNAAGSWKRNKKNVFIVCESTPIICGNFDNIIYSSSNIHLSYCLLKQNLNLSEALPNHLDTKHPGKNRELYRNKPRYEIVVLKPM